MANLCIGCKKNPVVMPSGSVICVGCGISANTVAQWDTFHKPRERVTIDTLIDELESPVSVLAGIASLAEDEGIRRLAGGVLVKLNKLDMEPFFVSKAEAVEYERKLREMLTRTGAIGVLRERVVRD